MSLTFPGLQANLSVKQQFSFEDRLDKKFLDGIVRFYNKNPDPQSLINRVEVWQDHSGISLVDISFQSLGCKRVMDVFSNQTHAETFHHDENNWCKLQITDRTDIRNVLRTLERTQTFVDGNSQGVMGHIISML